MKCRQAAGIIQQMAVANSFATNFKQKSTGIRK
jgi:hypothetical protein